jgi:hypothetical protein
MVNWFQERCESMVIALAELAKTLPVGTDESQLKQGLVDALRMCWFAASQRASITQNAWMMGDSEPSMHRAIDDANQILDAPGSAVGILEGIRAEFGGSPDFPPPFEGFN